MACFQLNTWRTLVAAAAGSMILLGCATSTTQTAEPLIKLSGPEANWANFSGAVVRNRADIVNDMIAQGMTPNVLVEDGDPALVRAIRLDNKEVVRALLNAKSIDIDMASDYGETALMLACFKGDMPLITELLERGASVNRVGGWTPLHYAATNGHEAVVDLLLKKGAQVNVQTASGITPLYMAARKPSRPVVMQLLKAGAFRDLCNDKGQSPAQAAKIGGDEELGRFLAVERCVDPRRNQHPLTLIPRAVKH